MFRELIVSTLVNCGYDQSDIIVSMSTGFSSMELYSIETIDMLDTTSEYSFNAVLSTLNTVTGNKYKVIRNLSTESCEFGFISGCVIARELSFKAA